MNDWVIILLLVLLLVNNMVHFIRLFFRGNIPSVQLFMQLGLKQNLGVSAGLKMSFYVLHAMYVEYLVHFT